MYAVILAGGKGERLWPKSTRGKAKHILSFGTRKVMIESTIRRLREKLPQENIFLVTTKKQYSSLKPYIGSINKKSIILEPEGRDTAAAICLAALVLEKRFGSVSMVVLPADHIIKDSDGFFENLTLADNIASKEMSLITLGIKPKYPSIGYGYIETGRKLRSGCNVVKRFVEKPKKKKAESFYNNKHYLWNSGIFVWKTQSILMAIKRCMPRLFYSLKDTVMFEGKKGYSLKLASVYSILKKVSIDYGVMEKVKENIFCVRGKFDWVDIGSWSSVEEIYNKNKDGNIILSNAEFIDVKDSIVIGERGHKIGVLGLKDLIIVQTKTGTLVCHKDKAQEVKDLVRKFEK